MIELVADRRVIVCAGAGGVGKTTVSAALALGLARRGRRVAVVTIDPARRLADALGLPALGGEPERLDTALLPGFAGELWAMTLDPARTFDTLVAGVVTDAAARDEILGTRIYRHIAGAVAGSHEYAAVATLSELERDDRFDAIVLDTPPSRSAVDILDAPARITRLVENPLVNALAAPASLTARIAARGAGVVLAGLGRITGTEIVDELRAFFVASGPLRAELRERAARIDALLASPGTGFVVVASPQRQPVDEAIAVGRALADRGTPIAALVANRVHEAVDPGAIDGDTPLARKIAATVEEVNLLATHDSAALTRLERELGRAATTVPHLDGDVSDIDRLLAVAAHLEAPAPCRRGERRSGA